VPKIEQIGYKHVAKLLPIRSHKICPKGKFRERWQQKKWFRAQIEMLFLWHTHTHMRIDMYLHITYDFHMSVSLASQLDGKFWIPSCLRCMGLDSRVANT